jgi:hypothetical protein
LPTGPRAGARRSRGYAGALFGAALICALSIALGGCGDETDTTESEVQGVGELKAGSVAPLAQCRDWNRGTRAEKLATIADVRSQINLEDAPVEAPPLTDEEAYGLFEDACRPAFAAGFRLYKLYARAAAFSPLLAR